MQKVFWVNHCCKYFSALAFQIYVKAHEAKLSRSVIEKQATSRQVPINALTFQVGTSLHISDFRTNQDLMDFIAGRACSKGPPQRAVIALLQL